MPSTVGQIQALLDANPFWLAPMAGVNDACFRGICKRFGAGITYTEMISAKGLHYNFESDAAQRLLLLAPGEDKVAVQLFGADPAIIAQQAVAVVALHGDRVAFIDINMGCPVSKVIRKGEGGALMNARETATEIVQATVRALKRPNQSGREIPVTVKFRRGVAIGDEGAVLFALAMEEAGASALAIHGRYAEQLYREKSDTSTITRVKQAVSIPVIGSGDVFTPADAVRMITPTAQGGAGADGVMIARGARGNPWIFTQARALLNGDETTPPSSEERFAVMREHARCIEGALGTKALVRMRKHAMWYCAGLPGAAFFRGRINALTTMDDLEALIEEYHQYLAQHTQADEGEYRVFKDDSDG